METWLTVIIVPIFVTIFVNTLTSSGKIKLPSNKNRIGYYKELLDMHVKKLKNENISRLEISRRSNQILEITSTMYGLYLQNCNCDSAMVKDLFNIQNKCMIMVESKKSNDIYTTTISELEQDIRKLYNTMIRNYKKYNDSESIGTQGSAIILLLVIIITTVSGAWCIYNGLLENDNLTFAVLAVATLLEWIAIVNTINLIEYTIGKMRGKKNEKQNYLRNTGSTSSR